MAWCFSLVNRLLRLSLPVLAACLLLSWPADSLSALARHHNPGAKSARSSGVSRSDSGQTRHRAQSSRSSSRQERVAHRRHGRGLVAQSKHRGRHHRGHQVAHQPKTRYAYPIGIFLASPPAFDQSGLPPELSASIRSAFSQGLADGYPARSLVKAGIVSYHPLRGGIFWRREPIKYVIIHSTETGIPLSAIRVIESWSSMGRRHPGAQYVIERDGCIYQALDPDLASVHVNIFKTLPGINNDNSVGIEMCHTGSQEYTESQVSSLIKLVVYLQGHYHVPDENVITHRYAQQGDHTDPVNFAWDRFIADKDRMQRSAVGLKVAMLNNEAVNWQTAILPLPEPFLELHQRIKLVPQALAAPPRDITSGVASYVKMKTEAEVAAPVAAAVMIRHKVEVVTPSHAAGISSKIPLNLPLRGPIELDPTAIKLLDHTSDTSSAPLPSARP